MEPVDVAATTEAAEPAAPKKTDLEKYLLLAQEPMNTDVLAWWKLRDHNEAANPSTGRPEGLPHLARMVRQWLGAPATSAGVERLFSKAGSMHHDLKGSMEDGSLEHSLIATANSEWWMELGIKGFGGSEQGRRGSQNRLQGQLHQYLVCIGTITYAVYREA
jgi:hypothetical protein